MLWVLPILVGVVALWLWKAFLPASVGDDETYHQSRTYCAGRYDLFPWLLSCRDYEWLQSQPGTTKKTLRTFRHTRSRIFRTMLRELKRETHLIYSFCMRDLDNSPDDSSLFSLLGTRFKIELAFIYLELCLVMYHFGYSRWISLDRFWSAANQLKQMAEAHTASTQAVR
jgi:hypothetical protein